MRPSEYLPVDIDERARYLSVQCVRLWLGTSMPGDSCVVVDEPRPYSGRRALIAADSGSTP